MRPAICVKCGFRMNVRGKAHTPKVCPFCGFGDSQPIYDSMVKGAK